MRGDTVSRTCIASMRNTIYSSSLDLGYLSAKVVWNGYVYTCTCAYICIYIYMCTFVYVDDVYIHTHKHMSRYIVHIHTSTFQRISTVFLA